ncbi:hypothetical protein TIFTF001_031591 [Ficus carica]|uniref:Uncharacterized protein n=1 Tax=Ficus carica TaxID=3494 RepID=A0AA88J4E5_FICCA|nr:hypothetical protein TIFTF001_031591 [Ficus carica]
MRILSPQEMGEFFSEDGEDGSVLCSLKEVNGHVKSGLIVEGIELRPGVAM